MEAREPKRKVLGRVKRYVRRSTKLLHHHSELPHASEDTPDTPRFDSLPAELVVHILSCVEGPRELAAAGGTCRAWYAASLEPAIWRRLFFAAKREKKLENALAENDDILALADDNSGSGRSSRRHSASFEERPDDGDGDDGDAEGEERPVIADNVDWRARYRATFDVPKGDRKRDSIVVRLDTNHFTAAGTFEPAITGEVVLNVASSRFVTHGVYVVVSGKEFHSCGAGRYQRTVRSRIMNLALSVSDDVPISQRHERKVVYEHGTHRLPFKINASAALTPPTFCRTAYQLLYSVSYKLRAVIAYPRFHPDHWTPKHAHRLVVMPRPRYEQTLLAKHQHIPGRTTTSYLNGVIKITISLPKTGFYLGELIQMQVDVENNSPVDFHFLLVSAEEQMRSPVLRDSFTTVTLDRHARKQRLKRLTKEAADHGHLPAGAGPSCRTPSDDGSHDSETEHRGDDNECEEGDEHHDHEEDDGEEEEQEEERREEGHDQENDAEADGHGKRKGKKKHVGEKWFAVEMPKGHSSHTVQFAIDENDTNGPPWNVPYSAYVEQRYVIHAKIKRKEGRSLLLGALEPSADSAPVVFVPPAGSAEQSPPE